MLLSYTYELLRDQNLEIGAYIAQKEKKTEKMRGRSLCKRNQQFPKTVDHGSIVGRNPLGYKMRKLHTQETCLTIGFGCWPWTASKIMDKQYFVNMSSA